MVLRMDTLENKKKVGSNSCSECIHFKSTDIENNEVECGYDEHERGD